MKADEGNTVILMERMLYNRKSYVYLVLSEENKVDQSKFDSYVKLVWKGPCPQPHMTGRGVEEGAFELRGRNDGTNSRLICANCASRFHNFSLAQYSQNNVKGPKTCCPLPN